MEETLTVIGLGIKGRLKRTLREILTEYKAASERTGPDDPVFVTSSGKPRSRHNLRQDVVDAVMTHANRLVEERGLQRCRSASPRTR